MFHVSHDVDTIELLLVTAVNFLVELCFRWTVKYRVPHIRPYTTCDAWAVHDAIKLGLLQAVRPEVNTALQASVSDIVFGAWGWGSWGGMYGFGCFFFWGGLIFILFT